VPLRYSRDTALIASMVLALSGIAALATWDAERESAKALEDFGREQETVAKSVAASVRSRLREAQRGPAEGRPGARLRPEGMLDGVASIERPGSLLLLLREPGSTSFSPTRGREISAAAIGRALDARWGYVRLTRTEAAALGLPARTALAGLAWVEDGAAGAWGVAVVASAERQRDRERRSQWRVILAVAVASVLVLGFGGVALRNQRKELILERELALADFRQERDERLERANRAAVVGALAIGITHEISTPLNVISARAEQLRDRLRPDDRNAQAAQIIIEQTEHIDQVIRGLLRLARGHEPSAQRISPASIVEGACMLVEHRFAKAGVALHRSMAEDLPWIHGELRLLEHALVNLLLNACDACDAGGTVELTASVRGGLVLLEVADDGVGISRRDIDHAMEPFFTTKAAGEGTGLGLTIAREIVTSHRGTLALESRVPRGTRAVLELPIPDEGHA
jgi:two-component system NtrC family sensor kinase